jgi:hypothetical protein
MTTISSSTSANVIAPDVERVYHQSNLVGDWKGVWTNNHSQIEFKVLNIRGPDAQVEYTHNGRTERGTGQVDGDTVTFNNVTIATRNGQTAALEFAANGAKQTAVLAKVPAAGDQSQQLVGTWSGFSRTNGQSVTFQVVSVNGHDAQVKLAANNSPLVTGAATVSKNSVMLAGKGQFTMGADGQSGNVMLQIGSKSYAIPVARAKPTTSSSSVNKLA